MNLGGPLIGVIGSGTNPYPDLSWPLGKFLAEKGCNLINGGGQGVMKEVAKAFFQVADRKGIAIGILPSAKTCETKEDRAGFCPLPGYPNSYIDLPIFTHLHLTGERGKNLASRNHIIILSADIIVALPGGPGTRSEIELALEYGKPILILATKNEWKEFSHTSAKTAKTTSEAFDWLNHQLQTK